MSRFHKIREFAELSGVTVKALLHYDRLGLLKPRRTESGYRAYSDHDLEILEQIIALKALGLSLKEVGTVLRRPPLEWRNTLRVQREALEERHHHLTRAIRAIRAAEEAIDSGKSVSPAMFKEIMEAIDMQDGIAAMKKYYSEEAWEQHRRYYEEGPTPEWRAFYRDAQALLGKDPECEEARALVPRWFDLLKRAHLGDPEVLTDSPSAWLDLAHWPPFMKQRAAEFQMEEVHAFLRLAALAMRKDCLSEHAWSRLMELVRQPESGHRAQWQARIDLFRDLEATLGEDPAGEKGRELAARWRRQIEVASGGEPEIRDSLVKGWSRRRYWPEASRWQVERLHLMSFERFERCADFLDRALEANGQ